ncbi:MAG: DMT family transporter [Blautia sp.]
MKKQQIPLKNSLILLLTATIWGIAFVAQSEGGDAVGAFTFNSTRSLIGSLVLIPVIFLLNKINPKDNKDESGVSSENSSSGNIFSRNRTLILGGISCGICFFLASNFQQLGIQYTSVGKAGFITACYIVIVPILGLFMKKKCSPFIWAAVAMALVGLYLLCITDGFSIGKGDILVLICAVLFSLHILIIDYFSPKVDGVKMSCIQFFICGVLSAIPALIFEHPQLSAFQGAWGAILYAGVMSCGVAYTLQIVGQKNMDPTVASLILSLESCISVLAGWIILGQKLSMREIIGCVVMFTAIVLAQLPQKETA